MDAKAGIVAVLVLAGFLAFILLTRTVSAAPVDAPGVPIPGGTELNLKEVQRIAAFYRIPEGRVITAYRSAQKYAVQFGVACPLLMAIAQTESTFNPNAVNLGDPSYGLCGVQEFWIDGRLGFTAARERLYDPDFNLFVAANILQYFENRHPARKATRAFRFPAEVAVYNLGESSYANRDRTSADEDYSSKVLGFYQRWSQV